MKETETPTVDTLVAADVYRWRFDDIEFDEAQYGLWLAGHPVTVERLPLQLLAELLRRPGEVVKHEEFRDLLWQGRRSSDNVLANAVRKLRLALGETAGARVVNVPRVGYRLTGTVERVAVGRKAMRDTNLAVGQPVPGREDFILLSPLGDGKSSAVWRARHSRLNRFLVFKFARGGEQLAALKREFTVCRLLEEELGQRTDLAEVQESNFSEAPFFLAYEDAGVDLRTWAEAGDPLASMSTEDRIALFLQIARAVAAAHSVGVLHRDLKPGNVLVAGHTSPISAEANPITAPRWQLKLIDFGSSHLLAPDRLAALGITAMGMTVNDASHPLLGATPNYLAPEVLSGQKPTTGSDLYALGLILYQLLAGDLRRPLATGWELDIADPLLVDDVRAATEGRPERRLASVAQLVERLESLPERRTRLEHAAETAQRLQAAAERLDKIRSRRPWMWAIAVCIALGALCATWFGVRAGVAQRKAEQATARATAINDFLNLDVLQSPDVSRIAATHSLSMVDVLARASDWAGERFKGDVTVLAQVRRQLGDIYVRMLFADQAEFQYRRAITVLEPSARSDDPELLAAHFGLAEALTAQGRPDQALAALEAAERAAGAATLAGTSIVAQRALRARVQVLMGAERDREALPFAMRLVRLGDEPSNDVAFRAGLRFDARQWLCEIDTRLGNREEATRLLAELAAPPFNRDDIGKVIFVRGELRRAKALIHDDRLDAAEQVLTALRESLVGTLVQNGLYRGLLSQALFEIQDRRGRFQEALKASEEAFDAYRSAFGEQHSLVTAARIQRALSELNLGRAADALRDLGAARLRLDANGRHADQLLAVDVGRAGALTTLGRHDEAIEILQSLRPIEEQPDAARRQDLRLDMRAELGRAMLASGETGPGRAAVGEALAGMRLAKSPAWKVARYESLLTSGSKGD